MSSHPSFCPHCGANVSEAPSAGPAGNCPQCGEPLGHWERRGRAAARRAWPKVVVAAVALAVIAGAGVVIARNAGTLFSASAPAAKTPAPAAPAVAGQPAEKAKDEEALWSHSRLLVVRADRGPVVALSRPDGPAKPALAAQAQKGLLAREMIRQAVLLAARDELGAATRDEELGDAPPDPKGNTSADFAWVLRYSGPATVKVHRDDAEKGVLFDHDVRPNSALHDVVDLAVAAEQLSRTEFPKVLNALGVEGKPNQRRPDADVPAELDGPLENLGFVEPLAAVRELHAVIRKDGESPARLGALVRGYAQLGVLNEHLWSPAHKAFKARAFLYAQRLIAQEPKSPWGRWHRAYVEALVGLHKRALDDLAEAAKLSRDQGAPKAPAWVDTIATYCHFDLTRLAKVEGSQAKFATFLRMLALEFPHHSTVALSAAKDLLSYDAECFRGHDVLYRVGGVANLHVATTFALEVLNQGVPRKIRAIGSLPEGVRKAIEEDAGEVAVVDALEQAGAPGADAGEPSWAVLGSLVRETRFALVEHRLNFMRNAWGVPVDQFWNESRPLVARHRFQPYLLATVMGTPDAERAFAAAVDASWLVDLEYPERQMVYHLERTAPNKNRVAWSLVQQHMDHLVRDFATQADLYDKSHAKTWSHNANKILMLSPENPYAMSLLVEVDWDAIQPRVAEWEKKSAEYLPLVGAFGRQYSELKQYDKAKEFLERYIKESPESWAFERLAANYKAQGDVTRWLATLDQYLKSGEDHGLDHARVRVEIANYYMANGQWEKAQPYAEAAAQTWAGWAMQCASRCYEGMKDWDRAELWVRRTSERYPGTALREWLKFCQRTGHGDINAAKALIEQFGVPVVDPAAQVAAARAEVAGTLEQGFGAWQKGESKEATDTLRKAWESSSPLLAGCALAALADEQGDTAQRDAFLGEVCTKHRAKAPKMIAVLQMFRDSFAKGDRDVPDPKDLERAVAGVSGNLRGNTEFFAGWLLRKHGKREEAKTYLKRSTETLSTNPWLKRIADDALQHMNDEPVKPAEKDSDVPELVK